MSYIRVMVRVWARVSYIRVRVRVWARVRVRVCTSSLRRASAVR